STPIHTHSLTPLHTPNTAHQYTHTHSTTHSKHSTARATGGAQEVFIHWTRLRHWTASQGRPKGADYTGMGRACLGGGGGGRRAARYNAQRVCACARSP